MSRVVLPEDVYCYQCSGDGHFETPDGLLVECEACHGRGIPEEYRTEEWDDRPGLPTLFAPEAEEQRP